MLVFFVLLITTILIQVKTIILRVLKSHFKLYLAVKKELLEAKSWENKLVNLVAVLSLVILEFVQMKSLFLSNSP